MASLPAAIGKSKAGKRLCKDSLLSRSRERKARENYAVSWLYFQAHPDSASGSDETTSFCVTDGQQPSLIRGLTGGELYALAIANIFRQPTYGNLGVKEILQLVNRRLCSSISIADDNHDAELITETMLAFSAPIRFDAHLALIEGVMQLYLREYAKSPALPNSSTKTPSSSTPILITNALQMFERNLLGNDGLSSTDLPLKSTQLNLMLFYWLNFVSSFSEPSEAENESSEVLRFVDGFAIAQLISTYCPDSFTDSDLLVDGRDGDQKSAGLVNWSLIRQFCMRHFSAESHAKHIFHFALPGDPFDIHSSHSKSFDLYMTTFLADLFFYFEVSPIAAVVPFQSSPGMSKNSQRLVRARMGVAPAGTNGLTRTGESPWLISLTSSKKKTKSAKKKAVSTIAITPVVTAAAHAAASSKDAATALLPTQPVQNRDLFRSQIIFGAADDSPAHSSAAAVNGHRSKNSRAVEDDDENSEVADRISNNAHQKFCDHRSDNRMYENTLTAGKKSSNAARPVVHDESSFDRPHRKAVSSRRANPSAYDTAATLKAQENEYADSDSAESSSLVDSQKSPGVSNQTKKRFNSSNKLMPRNTLHIKTAQSNSASSVRSSSSRQRPGNSVLSSRSVASGSRGGASPDYYSIGSHDYDDDDDVDAGEQQYNADEAGENEYEAVEYTHDIPSHKHRGSSSKVNRYDGNDLSGNATAEMNDESGNMSDSRTSSEQHEASPNSNYNSHRDDENAGAFQRQPSNTFTLDGYSRRGRKNDMNSVRAAVSGNSSGKTGNYSSKAQHQAEPTQQFVVHHRNKSTRNNNVPNQRGAAEGDADHFYDHIEDSNNDNEDELVRLQSSVSSSNAALMRMQLNDRKRAWDSRQQLAEQQRVEQMRDSAKKAFKKASAFGAPPSVSSVYNNQKQHNGSASLQSINSFAGDASYLDRLPLAASTPMAEHHNYSSNNSSSHAAKHKLSSASDATMNLTPLSRRFASALNVTPRMTKNDDKKPPKANGRRSRWTEDAVANISVNSTSGYFADHEHIYDLPADDVDNDDLTAREDDDASQFPVHVSNLLVPHDDTSGSTPRKSRLPKSASLMEGYVRNSKNEQRRMYVNIPREQDDDEEEEDDSLAQDLRPPVRTQSTNDLNSSSHYYDQVDDAASNFAVNNNFEPEASSSNAATNRAQSGKNFLIDAANVSPKKRSPSSPPDPSSTGMTSAEKRYAMLRRRQEQRILQIQIQKQQRLLRAQQEDVNFTPLQLKMQLSPPLQEIAAGMANSPSCRGGTRDITTQQLEQQQQRRQAHVERQERIFAEYKQQQEQQRQADNINTAKFRPPSATTKRQSTSTLTKPAANDTGSGPSASTAHVSAGLSSSATFIKPKPPPLLPRSNNNNKQQTTMRMPKSTTTDTIVLSQNTKRMTSANAAAAAATTSHAGSGKISASAQSSPLRRPSESDSVQRATADVLPVNNDSAPNSVPSTLSFPNESNTFDNSVPESLLVSNAAAVENAATMEQPVDAVPNSTSAVEIPLTAAARRHDANGNAVAPKGRPKTLSLVRDVSKDKFPAGHSTDTITIKPRGLSAATPTVVPSSTSGSFSNKLLPSMSSTLISRPPLASSSSMMSINSNSASNNPLHQPVLFKPHVHKTNRKLIELALNDRCLPGKVNDKIRNAALASLKQTDAHHFVILFRNKQCQYRGLYVLRTVNAGSGGGAAELVELFKASGSGPQKIENGMLECVYKYASNKKEFDRIDTATSLSVQVDAVVIKDIYWRNHNNNGRAAAGAAGGEG